MRLIILEDKNIIELAGNDLIEKHEELNKNLEGILTTIYHHFTSGDTVKRYQYSLKELGDYSSHYFYCEEQWMHLTSYDGEDLHKDEHQMLTYNINEIQARLAGIDVNSSLDALLDLAKNFTQHILVSDKKFRKYIINNPH